MAELQIRYLPDPVLRQVARPVKHVNRSIARLLDQMAEAMYEANGVGLAAPQVGISKRVIVVDVGEGLVELINPVLLRGEGAVVGVEGCLSIPGKAGDVERYEKVSVTGLDRHGNQKWIEATDYFARALQHELDHLDGVLFIDKALSVFDTTPKEGDGEEAEDASAARDAEAQNDEGAGPAGSRG